MHEDLIISYTCVPRGILPDPLISYEIFPSIFGLCLVASCKDLLCFLTFGEEENLLVQKLQERFPSAHIDPKRIEIFSSDFQYQKEEKLHALLQGTPFQISVWQALTKIKQGQLVSYEEVALYLGDKKKVRAVASAIGDNPISFLIPCHRVIHKNGTLGNYESGPERKRKILQWEKTI